MLWAKSYYWKTCSHNLIFKIQVLEKFLNTFSKLAYMKMRFQLYLFAHTIILKKKKKHVKWRNSISHFSLLNTKNGFEIKQKIVLWRANQYNVSVVCKPKHKLCFKNCLKVSTTGRGASGYPSSVNQTTESS